ncbi:DJ-1 family glyoxalase III [Methylophaga sp. OBS1]|jgi:4-methyl-5(b-hydroxyethyl)-thiazole monophosphate biosynthesis|uniref:DJ-1 family glyoxalase III n=1 Tax=Methylophaga sp. OBS1 TaxID=2991933 RepID=UPI002259AEC0|nr:DJ-1 family glyoxalase III [Methylophaga sp. OBS1]MCX4192404.1 DJ-1/PfpI family protein [Methylophaga sp. OBS1]
MASVLIPLAEGCEELEAVTMIDLLRRAGITVTTASLGHQTQLTASRQVGLVADTLLDTVLDDDFDMILLPGGQPGTDHLNNDHRVHALIKRLQQDNRYLAAICAAPMVLASAGVLEGKRATSYPGALDQSQWPTIEIGDDPVVIDGKILTSRGPGTAMDFALTIIELLSSRTTRDQVETSLVRP